MSNLQTKEGRIEATEKINSDCLSELKSIGIELCEDAMIQVSENTATLSVKEIDPKSPYFGWAAFASEISIYIRSGFFDNGIPEINFGSSGSFDPSNKSSYWRTIHAASLLKNWDNSIPVIKKYCDQYKNLSEEIF